MRFALLAELVAAISGALVLTVTVARVLDGLGLTEAHFGWVMAAYGLGATVASLAVAHLVRVSLVRWITIGAALSTLAVLPATWRPMRVWWPCGHWPGWVRTG